MTMAAANEGLDRQASQSAFVRGFIDDKFGALATRLETSLNPRSCAASSMTSPSPQAREGRRGLNPRSCAASSMTLNRFVVIPIQPLSQSAFVRGFIDDKSGAVVLPTTFTVSIRVRARLHR